MTKFLTNIRPSWNRSQTFKLPNHSVKEQPQISPLQEQHPRKPHHHPPRSPPSDYVLTRDYVDSTRINLQHFLWTEIFGYHIHPSIPSNEPGLRIADIGTGTGAWLSDLSSRLPESTQLDGLDISFESAPPPQWLPRNVTLRRWNIRGEVPSELIGLYDIVHIRQFGFVIRNDEAPILLKKLVSMLKPGGHLQWAEADINTFRIETLNPRSPTDALTRLIHAAQGQDERLRPDWVRQLPDLFEEAGLGEVECDSREAPPHLAFAMHECNLLVHELIARKLRNEAFLAELRYLMPRVAEETRQGAYWAFTRTTVVGKKPE